MRAKMVVNRVERWAGGDKITLNAVARSGSYPQDGSDEDNTFAKFTPSGELSLTITNPSLIGKIEPGRKFYLDFTEAE
ncbi:hypothetical protein BO068_005218 [Escherichia coli]|nr:hypothetical protein [Escherichia coli]